MENYFDSYEATWDTVESGHSPQELNAGGTGSERMPLRCNSKGEYDIFNHLERERQLILYGGAPKGSSVVADMMLEVVENICRDIRTDARIKIIELERVRTSPQRLVTVRGLWHEVRKDVDHSLTVETNLGQLKIGPGIIELKDEGGPAVERLDDVLQLATVFPLREGTPEPVP